MIVCLGWGSLIWDPKELPLIDSKPEAWRDDGPKLPIEFSRVSKNGRLTLVIDPAAPLVRVLWNPLRVTALADAVEALHVREDTDTDRPIGRWPSDCRYPFDDIVAQWARAKGFEGVVWTALGPRFGHENDRRPLEHEALEYLSSLPKGTYCLAEQYVRCAPLQIDTPYRRAIIESLGWAPSV